MDARLSLNCDIISITIKEVRECSYIADMDMKIRKIILYRHDFHVNLMACMFIDIR